MAYFDVFNGDADGLCALLQLRLQEPRESTLISGVKRDVGLLRKLDVDPGDQLHVLDISLDRNRQALRALLSAGAEVFYVDHHYAGRIPDHPGLKTLIDTSADVCTSILVDRHLRGAFSSWAVVGAFGDNLEDVATRLARAIGLSAEDIHTARELGTYLNYNGYGVTIEDLHFRPDELFRLASPYRSPFEFVQESRHVFDRLSGVYHDDLSRAANLVAHLEEEVAAAFVLPGKAWARRVMGAYANQLSRNHPNRAHAILAELSDGAYIVSVRAPLTRRQGADELCRRFPTGGGRTAAAGINALPADQVDRFLDEFLTAFGR